MSASPFALIAERSLFTDDQFNSVDALPGEEELSHLVEDLDIASDPSVRVPKTVDQRVLIVKPKEYAHFHCPLTLPLPSLWPDRPLLLRAASTHGFNAQDTRAPASFDAVPYPFETSLFKGHLLVRLYDNPKCSEYFKGKARLSSVVVTGQFKKPLSFADLVTGQEFCHAVKNPGTLLSAAALKLFKMLAPLLKVSLDKHETYFLSPLAQTVQAMHVATTPFTLSPDCEVPEETRLLGEEFANGTVDFAARKKHFSKIANLEKMTYDPRLYYTFDFYNDKINIKDFELRMLGKKFDLAAYLLGQPVRILARTLQSASESNSYAWNFEMWHEKQTGAMASLSDRTEPSVAKQ